MLTTDQDEEFLKQDGWVLYPQPSGESVKKVFFKAYHTPSHCFHNPDRPLHLQLSQSVYESVAVRLKVSYTLILRASLSDAFQVNYEVADCEFPGKLEEFIHAYDTFLLALWERAVLSFKTTKPGETGHRRA